MTLKTLKTLRTLRTPKTNPQPQKILPAQSSRSLTNLKSKRNNDD